MWTYNYNNNYLMHYGVKGMKWGVRRYQDEKGFLTPAGVAHYKKNKAALKKDRDEAWKARNDLLRRSENIRDLRNMKSMDPRFKNYVVGRKGSKYTYVAKNDPNISKFDEVIIPSSKTQAEVNRELKLIERGEFELRKLL